MIPKIIHYCWFGGKDKPDSVKRCIASWKVYCPDYEIKEWNELNFDVNANNYCREAYKTGKWAFVSDVARLVVLKQYGGIYMDTDVEMVKPFDDLLKYNSFMCFENKESVSIGTLGAQINSSLIDDFLNAYKNRHFIDSNGKIDFVPNLKIITPILVKKYGLISNGRRQLLIDRILVLPMESFIAKDNLTGWILMDDSTYAIHHYSATWCDDEARKYGDLQRRYMRLYMKKLEKFVLKIAIIRATKDFYGNEGVILKLLDYILKKSGGVDKRFSSHYRFTAEVPFEADASLSREVAV